LEKKWKLLCLFLFVSGVSVFLVGLFDIFSPVDVFAQVFFFFVLVFLFLFSSVEIFSLLLSTVLVVSFCIFQTPSYRATENLHPEEMLTLVIPTLHSFWVTKFRPTIGPGRNDQN